MIWLSVSEMIKLTYLARGFVINNPKQTYINNLSSSIFNCSVGVVDRSTRNSNGNSLKKNLSVYPIREVMDESDDCIPRNRSMTQLSNTKKNNNVIYKPQKVLGKVHQGKGSEVGVSPPDDPAYSKKCYIKFTVSNIFNNKAKDKFNSKIISESGPETAKKHVKVSQGSQANSNDEPNIYLKKNHSDIFTKSSNGIDIVTNQPKPLRNSKANYTKKASSSKMKNDIENEVSPFRKSCKPEIFTASSNGLDIVTNQPKKPQIKSKFKKSKINSFEYDEQPKKRFDPDPNVPVEKVFLKNSHSDFFTPSTRGIDIVSNEPKPYLEEVPRYKKVMKKKDSPARPRTPNEIFRKSSSDIFTPNTKALNIITNEPKLQSETIQSYKKKTLVGKLEDPLPSRNKSAIGLTDTQIIHNKFGQSDLFTQTTKGLNIVTNRKVENKSKLDEKDKVRVNREGKVTEVKIQFDPKDTDIEKIKNVYRKKGINIYEVVDKTELVKFEHDVLTYHFKTSELVGDLNLKVSKAQSRIKSIEPLEKTVVISTRNNDLFPARADWLATKKLKGNKSGVTSSPNDIAR